MLALLMIGFANVSNTQDKRRLLDLNGYLLRGVQTKDSIVLYFGKPDKYRSMMSELGLDEVFSYGKSIIRLGENGNAFDFVLNDKPYLPLSFGGLVIEKSYTHEQIIEIMGKPDSVKVHISDPNFESNDVRIYYYNSNLFYLTEGKLDVLDINKTGLKIKCYEAW